MEDSKLKLKDQILGGILGVAVTLKEKHHTAQ